MLIGYSRVSVTDQNLALQRDALKGINLSFVMAQVVDRRYSAVLDFENDADAT